MEVGIQENMKVRVLRFGEVGSAFACSQTGPEYISKFSVGVKAFQSPFQMSRKPNIDENCFHQIYTIFYKIL